MHSEGSDYSLLVDQTVQIYTLRMYAHLENTHWYVKIPTRRQNVLLKINGNSISTLQKQMTLYIIAHIHELALRYGYTKTHSLHLDHWTFTAYDAPAMGHEMTLGLSLVHSGKCDTLFSMNSLP